MAALYITNIHTSQTMIKDEIETTTTTNLVVTRLCYPSSQYQHFHPEHRSDEQYQIR